MRKTFLNFNSNSAEYYRIVRKFSSFSSKLDHLMNTGKFWEFNSSVQQKLVTKLRNLFKKLSRINPNYALKIAGATMCFTLISNFAGAQNPNFANWINPNNPFQFSSVNGSSNYYIIDGAFADIDHDGDLDAVLLTNSYTPVYFENVNGHYVENSSDNPFNYCCGTSTYLPNIGVNIDIADFDGDGDLDAVGGDYCGFLHHYQLTSASGMPPRFEAVYSGSPIWPLGSSFNFGGNSNVKFCDIDGDGDLDLVGTRQSCGTVVLIAYLQLSNHTFSYANCNGLNFYTYPGHDFSSHLEFADMDGDGDEDLFIHDGGPFSPGQPPQGSSSSIIYVQNNGNGAWATSSNVPLPLALMPAPYFPLLADMDSDGDVDVFIPGENNGGTPTTFAFENLAVAVPVAPFVALIAFIASGFGIFKRNRKKKVA